MASITVMTVRDDLTGAEGAVPVRFGFENLQFEIDLTHDSRDALLAVLQPYMDAGRRLRANGTPARSSTGATHNPSKVRAWARANGMDCPATGRIPGAIFTAYTAANY